MGECELCGAIKVAVQRVRTGKTEVAACGRCTDKMNLGAKQEAPGIQRARTFATRPAPKKKKRNDIITRVPKELAGDF